MTGATTARLVDAVRTEARETFPAGGWS